MLGAFWNGRKVQTKQFAELRAKKMQQFLIMAMSGAFIVCKTWTKKELKNMKDFGPGEIENAIN